MRPVLNVLEDELKEKVVVEAIEILEEIGFFVENQDAIEILKNEGVKVEQNRAIIPRDLVKRALKTAPSSISLFDREGKEVSKLEGDNICFDPGSAALNVLDTETNEIRQAVTKDFIDFTKIVNREAFSHLRDIEKEIMLEKQITDILRKKFSFRFLISSMIWRYMGLVGSNLCFIIFNQFVKKN